MQASPLFFEPILKRRIGEDGDWASNWAKQSATGPTLPKAGKSSITDPIKAGRRRSVRRPDACATCQGSPPLATRRRGCARAVSPAAEIPRLQPGIVGAGSSRRRLRPSAEAAPDLGKTEAWYIVTAEPESLVYAGLKPGVDRSALERRSKQVRSNSCCIRFIPGRRRFVHPGRHRPCTGRRFVGGRDSAVERHDLSTVRLEPTRRPRQCRARCTAFRDSR